MKCLVLVFLAALSIAAGSIAHAAETKSPGQLSNDQIKQEIIRRSIASYPGPCPCPYNIMRNGRRCGGKSAYSRPGGRSLVCLSVRVCRDVHLDQRREFYRNFLGL